MAPAQPKSESIDFAAAEAPYGAEEKARGAIHKSVVDFSLDLLGYTDQSERAGVTNGMNMDGFVTLRTSLPRIG